MDQLSNGAFEKLDSGDDSISPTDTKPIPIPNGKVTQWNDEACIPAKPNKFRPVYVSLMLQLSDALTNGLTYDDIVSERHFGTYFVTPIFAEPDDSKYVTDILIPYLRAVAKDKHIDWNVVPTNKKGRLGVVVPGRLAASLLQGMASVKPAVPYLFNFLFMEEV